MNKDKPLKTRVFCLKEFNGNVQSLYDAVVEFQAQHTVVQVFANDLFDNKMKKVEVVYSTTTFGVSHQTFPVIG